MIIGVDGVFVAAEIEVKIVKILNKSFSELVLDKYMLVLCRDVGMKKKKINFFNNLSYKLEVCIC